MAPSSDVIVSSSTPDVPDSEEEASGETLAPVSAVSVTPVPSSSSVPDESETIAETPGDDAALILPSAARLGMKSLGENRILVICFVVVKMAL